MSGQFPELPLLYPPKKKAAQHATPTPSASQTKHAKNVFSNSDPVTRLVGSRRTGNNALGVRVPLDVRGLQQQLVKAGYRIKVDGQLGPETLSAMRDYYGKPHETLDQFKTDLTDPQFAKNGGGVGHPMMWDKTHVNVAAPYKPATVGPDGQPAAGATTYGTDVPSPMVNLPPTSQIPQGQLIPIGRANFGTMIDPNTADAIAGAQFDPQISAEKLAVAEDPLQAAQNLKDIGSWYGQVGQAEQTAATRDHAMTAAGTGSISDAAAALAASLGGSANQGAHVIDSAGQNAQGTIAALGASTDEYMNDIGPLLAAEGAEQKTTQSRLDAKQALADQSNLTALQTSRGEAKSAAQAQIEQENNALAQARAQMADQILGQNNDTRQQGFANQMSLTNAEIAAEMSGLQVQKASNPNAFVYASADAKSKAQLGALNSLANLANRGLKITPSIAHQVIVGMYQGMGWNTADPTVAQAIGATMNVWQNTSGGV